MTWFAVHTHPREEELAAEHLRRQGFDGYLPRYLKRRSHARRVQMVPAPLFPRYLFVNFDIATTAWRAIRSTRGVVDLVRNGNHPIAVPDKIIAGIRERQDADGYVLLGKHLHLARGDSFRIDRGPFASHLAIFEQQRDSERVIALLSLLGREVTVELPIGAIAPASL
jgi:transcriptional antiterminator RfaH